ARLPHRAAWTRPLARGHTFPPPRTPARPVETARSPSRASPRLPRNPPAPPRHETFSRRLARSLQKVFAPPPRCTTGRSESASASHVARAPLPARSAACPLLSSTL